MKDGEIDEILKSAAESGPKVKAALLRRVAESIQPSMGRVRPLPKTWELVSGVVLVCAAVALAGATRAGFGGFARMDLLERVVIFATLGILTWVAGTEFVHEMIPGSRRRMSAGGLLGLGCAVLIAMFALLFHDYHVEEFVPVGFNCLVTGVLHAIPAGLLSWFVLRRGFAVDPVSSGLVAGMVAGLAGVGLLELHCPNFQTLHLLVWHTAVLVVSGALGVCVGWAMELSGEESLGAGFDLPGVSGDLNPADDAVYLPLKKGSNELMLAVSELGGGWDLYAGWRRLGRSKEHLVRFS